MALGTPIYRSLTVRFSVTCSYTGAAPTSVSLLVGESPDNLYARCLGIRIPDENPATYSYDYYLPARQGWPNTDPGSTLYYRFEIETANQTYYSDVGSFTIP